MKRGGIRAFFISTCLACVLMSLPGGVNSTWAESEKGSAALPKSITFGTLSPGTMMYAVASGLAKVASDNSPMTVVVVPGSQVANMTNMDKQGRPAILLTDSNALFQAYMDKIAPDPTIKGMPTKNFYPFACRNLRSLMAGSFLTFGMLVRNDSGLTTVGELRGKRVAWGWAAAPFQLVNTLTNLYNGGLTIDDVKPVPVTSMVPSVRALVDGRLDSTSVAVGMGAISEADAMVGVHYLSQSMTPESIQAARRCRAGVRVIPIPPGPAGLKKKTPLLASPMQVAASTNLSEEVAYTLVKTWWNNHEKWQNIHPILKLWTQKSFLIKDITIPYHAGAVKFYKEIGIWDADMDQIQARLLQSQ